MRGCHMKVLCRILRGVAIEQDKGLRGCHIDIPENAAKANLAVCGSVP